MGDLRANVCVPCGDDSTWEVTGMGRCGRHSMTGWHRVAGCLLALGMLAVAACGGPSTPVASSPSFSGAIPGLTVTASPSKKPKNSDPILAGLAPAQQLTVKLMLAHMSLDQKLGQ